MQKICSEECFLLNCMGQNT